VQLEYDGFAPDINMPLVIVIVICVILFVVFIAVVVTVTFLLCIQSLITSDRVEQGNPL